MQEALALLAHAKVCLEIADQISDRREAQKLRTIAAEYRARARARELEDDPDTQRWGLNNDAYAS